MGRLPTSKDRDTEKRRLPLHTRFYGLLLLAYPAEFRREYGPHMAQVFRDGYYAEKGRGQTVAVLRLWLRTLADLVLTAPKEHLENLGKENAIMKTMRRDALALLGCIGIIVIAFFLLRLLLRYGRSHEVSSISIFGYVLDALVMAGIVGNLIVFLLVKTTKLNPLRTALWTFLVVNAAPVLVLAIIGSRIDPQFRLGSVLLGYVVSFLFWLGLHWVWSQTKKPPRVLA
jgi:hypothetical protein